MSQPPAQKHETHRASRPALDMPGQTCGLIGPQQMKDCSLEHLAA